MKMEKKHLVGLLAAANVVSVFMAGNVMAEEDAKKVNYAQVKVGVAQPTGDLDDADYDAGGDFSIAYGRYLNKYLVVEAGLDASGFEKDFRGANAVAGSYKQDNTLGAFGFLVTLKGEVSAGPMDFFAGAGGGIYAVTLTSDIESSRLGDFAADDSDGVFGAHVVAGATYNINERFFLGIEGKYRWMDDVDIRETVATLPVEYSGDLSGYTVTLNAGFRF